MKTLLVAVDFSNITEKVITSAIALTRAFEARAILLHIVQPPVVATSEYTLPVGVIEEAVAANEKSSRKKLAGFAGRFRQAGINCVPKLAVGSPVDLILAEAKKSKADFIVMGSHGHGKLYDFLVGSTASGVIKKTKCGVIILPPGKKSGRA
jgi:nucleotide-binding universal stress UspA family protein